MWAHPPHECGCPPIRESGGKEYSTHGALSVVGHFQHQVHIEILCVIRRRSGREPDLCIDTRGKMRDDNDHNQEQCLTAGLSAFPLVLFHLLLFSTKQNYLYFEFWGNPSLVPSCFPPPTKRLGMRLHNFLLMQNRADKPERHVLHLAYEKLHTLN